MTVNLPVALAWTRDTNQRMVELKRMRMFATTLLVVMLAVFVATSVFKDAWPGLVYVRVFAESAMVGACADWFAVVALFRHPLGIPIPHTAIVPRHKKRIGDSLGMFIFNNFLAPIEVTSRLERVDAAGWIARWLKEPDNAKLAAARLQNLFPPLLHLLSEEQIRTFSLGMIRTGIDSVAVAPLVARAFSVLMKHGYHDTIYELLLEAAQSLLISHKEGIRLRGGKGVKGWLTGWVDHKMTDLVLAEMQDTLTAAHSPNHPWRSEFSALISRLTGQLADDPEMIDRCERIKAEVLDNTVVDGYLDWLGSELAGKLQDELASHDGFLSRGLEHALQAVGVWLDTDTGIRATVNHWAHELVLNTIVPNRAEIGAFVTDVVAKWDTKTLVDKLELQVGKDLQYIRINGTLVGGLVGLTIFVVDRLFG